MVRIPSENDETLQGVEEVVRIPLDDNYEVRVRVRLLCKEPKRWKDFHRTIATRHRGDQLESVPNPHFLTRVVIRRGVDENGKERWTKR